MVFSRYNRGIIYHVILLALLTVAFFWTLEYSYMAITSYSLVLVWAIVILHLIWYLKKTNRELALFLEAFRNRDTTIKFRDYKKDPTFAKLHHEFNQIIQGYSQARIETETEHLFFQNTIKHVGVGLIAFDEKGNVELINDFIHPFSVSVIFHTGSRFCAFIGLRNNIYSVNPELLAQIRIGF